jgi:hypothetical protein
LNNLYKPFTQFILNSVNSFLSVIKILLISKYQVRLPKAEDASCIVLANGPSLKNSLEKNKDSFKRRPLICVNTFAITAEFTELKPRHYIMLDPFFWERKTDPVASTFKSLIEKTQWPMNLFVPSYAAEQSVFIELVQKNSYIKIVPFNYTVFKGFPGLAHWFYRKNLASPQSYNVTIVALFLGINMGYKEIYLVGADHTWHENLHMSEDNVLHTKVTHFYENDTEIKLTPFYKGGDPNNGVNKAHEFFNIWSRTFHSYLLVNEYAISQHCMIYNSSEVSFIDAFKRTPLPI